MIDEESITSSGALSVYHAAIDELARRYGSLEDSEHLSADEMIPPNGTFLVARRDGHLVGGVGLRAIADPGLRLGEVKRLWVRPDQRREGAGIALMGALEDRARSMGFVRLYLETGPSTARGARPLRARWVDPRRGVSRRRVLLPERASLHEVALGESLVQPGR